MADALCTRTISAGGGADLARMPQSASAARSVRDALAKVTVTYVTSWRLHHDGFIRGYTMACMRQHVNNTSELDAETEFVAGGVRRCV